MQEVGTPVGAEDAGSPAQAEVISRSPASQVRGQRTQQRTARKSRFYPGSNAGNAVISDAAQLLLGLQDLIKMALTNIVAFSILRKPLIKNKNELTAN